MLGLSSAFTGSPTERCPALRLVEIAQLLFSMARSKSHMKVISAFQVPFQANVDDVVQFMADFGISKSGSQCSAQRITEASG